MLINGKPVNPGELRTAVLLAPRSVTTATGGFQSSTPDTSKQVSAWARWTNAHGSEVWAASAAGVSEAATVLIRYQSGIDTSWTISNDNGASWWEIVLLDNIQQRSEYIELKVKRMRSA